MGQMSFPAGGLARHGRASAALSSRRPSKATVPSPGFAGANRRRPQMFFRGRMYLRTACATVLTACPAVPADPKSARSMRSFGRPRGPGRLRCYAPRSSNDGTRGDGGGSHRLTGPVASSCAPADVHQSHACLLHAATGFTRARAGRPAVRPLLSSNAGLCFHRAGRLQKLFRPMQRVHPDRYRTGIRVSAVQLCFYPRDILQMSTHHTEPRRAAGSLS
jgi:hypothetical protein